MRSRRQGGRPKKGPKKGKGLRKQAKRVNAPLQRRHKLSRDSLGEGLTVTCEKEGREEHKLSRDSLGEGLTVTYALERRRKAEGGTR